MRLRTATKYPDNRGIDDRERDFIATRGDPPFVVDDEKYGRCAPFAAFPFAISRPGRAAMREKQQLSGSAIHPVRLDRIRLGLGTNELN